MMELKVIENNCTKFEDRKSWSMKITSI